MDTAGTALNEECWEGYRLSRQQERLWALSRSQKIGRSVAQIELDGQLDRAGLVGALGDLVERHEILRTSFRPVLGGKSPALMVIGEDVAPALSDLDISGFARDAQAQIISDYLRSERNCPAGGRELEPTRFTLYALAPNRHTLVVSAPRLCLDASSLAMFFQKLGDAYLARRRGQPAHAGEIVQYADFAQWQLESGALELADPHIQPETKRAVPPLHLPLELVGRAGEYATVPWTAPGGTLSLLSEIACRNGTTPEVALQACWQAALWLVSGRPEQVMVETNLACRPFGELAEALGCFETHVPIGIEFTAESTLDDVVAAVAMKLDLELACHHGSAADCASVGSEIEHKIGFTYSARSERIEADSLVLTLSGAQSWSESFKLHLGCEAVGRSLMLTIRYVKQGFAEAGIDAIAHALRAVIGAADAPDRHLDELALLDEGAAAQVVACWNWRRGSLAGPALWHDAFSRQAAREPEALAVVYEDRQWTYSELDRFTNRMARALRKRGAGPGCLVGLLLERSDFAIASMIAILKAGGAYLPLDPALPSHRLSVIVRQASPVLLVTDAAGTRAGCFDLPSLSVNSDRSEIENEDDAALPTSFDSRSLAYVLFTSGSSGAPKGVMIEHRHLMHYVDGLIDRLGIREPARYVAHGTLSTDLGNTTILASLCSGGVLDVFPVNISSDPQALGARLAAGRYDVLKITPSHLAALCAEHESPANLMPRRHLILGGEALSWGQLRLFRTFAGGCRIFNHYGPTETCVGVVAGDVTTDRGSGLTCDLACDLASTVPLGTPLRYARTYVLDHRGRPVPLGVTGELWIGGKTVARGYVDLPAETSCRFLSDPWGEDPDARMYRSGDLVRQLPDGRIEFLGRADRQTKVRGFRVELPEIEAVMQQHENVAASFVVEAGESGAVHLVGYVIAADGTTGPADWLRPFLKSRLPEFMIPSHLIALARFPLTAAGKIDRAMLPDPETIRNASSGLSAAPRTKTEIAVAGIFSELLLLDRVGVGDDFFEIGGHSLLATRLLSRLRAAFSVDLSLRAVFENATVEGLSAAIDSKRGHKHDL
ncbi:amino acid adenylation domain-containing protein [Bradyrhizobium sp. CB1015]|uniref:non-ribosomal peptide synthetase n=1 Tax=Bradyrhizobium sp. CB1015 TaxID=2976822 RepID=UPI0021AA3047|nr:amino acid adenylation domain-containing protein [Bradyrhizobium sp. CB1015]UWU92928.1 amino acid adenylation domain-containing protein [Bradyrhizobium sp. CB1015]